METLLQDLRYGFRMLRKSPGFTATAVLTLALGIGANTAIFSLLNGLLIRALPYPQPDRLVRITGTYPKGAFAAMREQFHSADVAAYVEGYQFNLTGTGEPVRLNATLVSVELFWLLGMPAQLGRTFQPGEDHADRNRYVILSHAFWERQFGSDPSIVGHQIKLEGVDREVVGVMPASFRFPSPETEIWIPLDIDPRNTTSYWAGDYMPVIGRLRTDFTFQQATAEARVFQSHVRTMFPWTMPADWNADVAAVDLQQSLSADIRLRLLILLGSVVLVLLIACANVANLILSREMARQKEIAIRVSLGAARTRVVRQLLTESVVMAAFGGVLGLGIGKLGLVVLTSALPADAPRLRDLTIDWRVMLFTAGVAMVTGIVAGLAPALQCSRTGLTSSLNAGSRGSTVSLSRRLRTGLVMCELALAVLLVSGASLLMRSLWALAHVDPGFRAEHLLTAHITPNESFCDDPARCVQFYGSLVDKVRAQPGVSGAAVVNTLPLGGRVAKRAVTIENYVPPQSGPFPLFRLNAVSADYLHVMGMSLLRGRGFTEADSLGNPPVAIISESTTRHWWPNQDPIGKHVRTSDEGSEWYTIVGVVSDVRAYDLRESTPDWINGTIYVPYGPKATLEGGRVPAEMTLAVRSTMGEAQIGELIRQAVSSLNAATPVTEIRAMPDLVSSSASAPQALTLLFGSFAGLALILGIIGIYGVISFFVQQRTREIGIRIALGAQPRSVLATVLGEGMFLAMGGLAFGLVAALVLTRFLRSLLYGVTATDPLVFVCVAFLFAFVAMAASFIPARRAAKVDPMVALRYE